MQACETGQWRRPRSQLGEGNLGALATLLAGGDANVGEVARARAAALIDRSGGLLALARRLRRPVQGISEGERRCLLAALDLGVSWVTTPPTVRRLDRPARLAEHAGPLLALDTEVLLVLALDSGQRLLGQHRIGGGVAAVHASAADVLRPALALGATRLALIHNHPSGDPEPSDADVRFTVAIARAAKICAVPLMDHVVVARGGWRSLRAGGGFGDG